MLTTDQVSSLFGFRPPWHLSKIVYKPVDAQICLKVDFDPKTQLCCPTCGNGALFTHSKPRQWRHTGYKQIWRKGRKPWHRHYQTKIVAWVPQCSCLDHGSFALPVPWESPKTGFFVTDKVGSICPICIEPIDNLDVCILCDRSFHAKCMDVDFGGFGTLCDDCSWNASINEIYGDYEMKEALLAE